MAMTAGTQATSLKARQKAVEARLAQVGAPRHGPAPPPEGRTGVDDHAIARLCDALVELGPLFAGFGRYLSSRADLVGRRDAADLARIAAAGDPMSPPAIDTMAQRQFGRPLRQHFFEFDYAARRVDPWTEQHDAWLAPGVPVSVTLVRADAESWLADAPHLARLHPWFDAPADVFAAAADDYVRTLARRLDMTSYVAAFAALTADLSSTGGGFSAPVCYRDHCAPGVLTVERLDGPTVADLAEEPALSRVADSAQALARRIASAWMCQAIAGRLVPFGFTDADLVVAGDRLVLVAGAFEPHGSVERRSFLAYANAVAEDDPDAAVRWILGSAPADRMQRFEDDIRRRLRQAVPFRDGEWSGDDRFAEQAFVQWRMSRLAGWTLSPHHLHVYGGLHAVSAIASALAPDTDVVLQALHDERLRAGLTQARHALDPSALGSEVGRRMQEMLAVPRALDQVLTLASEGRLRVNLNVPESDRASDVRNRTIVLVASLVALTGLASLAHYLAPALGGGAERLAAVAALGLGGWLLVAAARM